MDVLQLPVLKHTEGVFQCFLPFFLQVVVQSVTLLEHSLWLVACLMISLLCSDSGLSASQTVFHVVLTPVRKALLAASLFAGGKLGLRAQAPGRGHVSTESRARLLGNSFRTKDLTTSSLVTFQTHFPQFFFFYIFFLMSF